MALKFEQKFNLTERLPVWTSLSELFLDTELGDYDFNRIANSLKNSPYKVDEIERILRDEVAPAFAGNLWSPAGEWQPWSENDVLRIMKRQAESRWITRIITRFAMRTIPSEWAQIASRLR